MYGSEIIDTAFTVNQIIDWIDQAILRVHTSNGQFEKLERVGIIRASDMLTTTSDGKLLQSLSNITGLDKDELKVLRLTLLSAINIKVVAHFRWQSSLDKTKVTEAALIQPAQPWPAPIAAPREQESLRLGLEA